MTGFSNVDRTLGGDRSRDIHRRFDGFTPRTLRSHLSSNLSTWLPLSSPPRTFDLILSFPLLEDMTVFIYEVEADNDGGSDELSTVVQPSNLPTFTGSLNLVIREGWGLLSVVCCPYPVVSNFGSSL